MLIQDKVAWNSEVEKSLAFLKTLGVDCVALELPDDQSADAAIDLSTRAAATAFFNKAKATVAAHGMELRTLLATSGFDEIKRGVAGRDQKIAFLLDAVHAMGAAGIPILAYNFKLRAVPQNIRPRSVARQRHAVLPGLCHGHAGVDVYDAIRHMSSIDRLHECPGSVNLQSG